MRKCWKIETRVEKINEIIIKTKKQMKRKKKKKEKIYDFCGVNDVINLFSRLYPYVSIMSDITRIISHGSAGNGIFVSLDLKCHD